MTVCLTNPGHAPAGKPTGLRQGPSATSLAAANSLLFSLEDVGSPMVSAAQQLQLQAQLSLLEQSLGPLLQPRGPFHRKLLRDVHLFHDILLVEDGEVDGVVLASKLTMAGYRVAVRQALGGGSGVAVFSNLRHSFLLVTAQDCPCAGTDFIVEPHFREQFEISHPTPRYSGLLEMLPSVMVGTAAQLTPLVQLLCAEMSLAFEQHGLSLPPWRQSKSLLSKWLPSKARDYDLSPYASPRAASPDLPFTLSCATVAAAVAAAQQQASAAQQQEGGCASEAASGTLTPALSGADYDSSPRAVLRGASAVLLSQQQRQQAAASAAQGGEQQQAANGAAAPRPPKSLLSSSLAATNSRRSPQHDSASEEPPPRAAAATLPAPALVHHGAAGLTYRISSEWQQPAIRTVKMQGQTQAPHTAATAVC